MGQGTQGPAPIQPPLPHSGVCRPLGTPNQHRCRVTGLLPADCWPRTARAGPALGSGRDSPQGAELPAAARCPLLPAAHCPHRRGRGDWASAGQLRPLVAAVGRCRTCRQRANPIPSPAPRILCTALTYWRVALGPARGGGRRVGRHHPVPEGSQTDSPRRQVTFHSSRRSGSPPSHSSPSKLAPSAHR